MEVKRGRTIFRNLGSFWTAAPIEFLAGPPASAELPRNLSMEWQVE